MNNIPHPAEERNVIPTANNANKAASDASVPTGNVLIRGSQTVKKTHSFSRSLVKKLAQGKTSNRAREQAINLATVLQRLCWVIQKRTAQGKPWYAATVARFTSRLVPYLSPSGVHEMLGTWCNLDYVQADEDRTPTRYTVTKHAAKAAGHDRIRFNPEVAVAFGIMVAVLLHNLCYHLRVELSKYPGVQPFYALSPRVLATVLPYSDKSLKRARKTLLDANVIVRHPACKRLYSIPDWMDLLPLRGTVAEKGHHATVSKGTVAETKGTMAEKMVPVAENVGSVPDESQSATSPRKRDGKEEERQPQTLPLSPVPSPAAMVDATGQSQRDEQEVASKEQEQKVIGPESISFDQLQAINRTNDKAVSAFSKETLEAHQDALEHLSYSALANLPDENLFEFLALPDRDALSAAFAPFVRATISDLHAHPVEGITRDVTDPLYFPAALEVVTLAFHRTIHPKLTKRASTATNQRAADFVTKQARFVFEKASRATPLWEGLEAAKTGEEVAPWFQYQLPASEKASLFRETVDDWNRTGWMFADWTYRYNLIKVDDKGMELVEELFANNPELSVGELMVVLNGCVDKQREMDAPGNGERDDYWHVRRVDTLSFFASKLGDILKQLDLTNDIVIPVLLA